MVTGFMACRMLQNVPHSHSSCGHGCSLERKHSDQRFDDFLSEIATRPHALQTGQDTSITRHSSFFRRGLYRQNRLIMGCSPRKAYIFSVCWFARPSLIWECVDFGQIFVQEPLICVLLFGRTQQHSPKNCHRAHSFEHMQFEEKRARRNYGRKIMSL